jgi:hypothetical protein
MLPNFTVVICGAILTVFMLAVAGSGLIDPQTRTRIGAMPEIGRPMMQHMITEPAAREQFAAYEMSRRAEELMRLRDLAPTAVEPAPAAEHDDDALPAVDSAAAADALPAAVAEAAPEEAAPPVAEKAPGRDGVGLLAPEDSRLAAEPAVELLPAAPPIAAPVDPPAGAPERAAAAPPSEPPAVAEHGESLAEMPASPSLELALADPAVPAEETPAKHAARAAEPEEPSPVRRLMPRFVPLLPRIIPSLVRHAPARVAPSVARVTPTLVRHVHAKAKAEVAKTDIAKAAAAPRKPARHVIRHVQHRPQRTYVAPGTAANPYSGYSVTSGVQYR